MIPPQELEKREFVKTIIGFDQDEVRDYINYLFGKYEELYNQCDSYDKKLRIVAERIAEMQSEEENIKKLAESVRKYHDKIIDDAKAEAKKIIDAANETVDQMVTGAETKAEKAVERISAKAREQIISAQEKSDALLLSTKTHCAKILSEFKKEIKIQRDGIVDIKNKADSFNSMLFGMYKEHIVKLNEAIPKLNIDLNETTESYLLEKILRDIKEDAINLANGTSSDAVDFNEELIEIHAAGIVNREDYKIYSTINNEHEVVEPTQEEENSTDKKLPVIEPDYKESNENEPEQIEDINSNEDDVKIYAGSIQQNDFTNTDSENNVEDDDSSMSLNNELHYSNVSNEYIEEDDEDMLDSGEMYVSGEDTEDETSEVKRGLFGLFSKNKKQKVKHGKNKSNDDYYGYGNNDDSDNEESDVDIFDDIEDEE